MAERVEGWVECVSIGRLYVVYALCVVSREWVEHELGWTKMD